MAIATTTTTCWHCGRIFYADAMGINHTCCECQEKGHADRMPGFWPYACEQCHHDEMSDTESNGVDFDD